MVMIKIFIFLVSCSIAEPGCRVNLVPFLNWCVEDIKVFLVRSLDSQIEAVFGAWFKVVMLASRAYLALPYPGLLL